jgi:hypothetical protein
MKLGLVLILLTNSFVAQAAEPPFWRLEEIQAPSTLKEYDARAIISIHFSSKQGVFVARGDVGLSGNCQWMITASGELRVTSPDKTKEFSLALMNFPLVQTPEALRSSKFSFEDKLKLISDQSNVSGKGKFFAPSSKKGFEAFPIQWIDIDSDGVEELVVMEECQQRLEPAFNIYEFDESRGFNNPIWIHSVDPRPKAKKLKSYLTGGACDTDWFYYQSINGRYQLVKKEEVRC